MNLYGFFHFVYINFIRTHRYIPGGDEVAILLQELLLGVCQEAAVFLQRKLEDLQCEEQISVRSWVSAGGWLRCVHARAYGRGAYVCARMCTSVCESTCAWAWVYVLGSVSMNVRALRISTRARVLPVYLRDQRPWSPTASWGRPGNRSRRRTAHPRARTSHRACGRGAPRSLSETGHFISLGKWGLLEGKKGEAS